MKANSIDSAAVAGSLAFLFSLFIAAPGLALECSSKDLVVKAVYDNFPGAGYWMQAGGNCRITYTSVGGVSSAMYNICQRQRENISDYIDAFPLPDGDLYTHPGGMGFRFYDIDQGIEKGIRAEATFNDRSFLGNYQSIGTLKESTPQKRHIRVAMGNQAGMIQEYKIEKDAAGKTVIAPVLTRPVPICKNLETGGLDTEIPMISRDGTMISGRNRITRKTEIYKIDMKTAQCSLITTVPVATNKVSFDFANKNIFFTAYDSTTGKKRLASMEISSGKVFHLSGPDEDVQYVTNRQDGSIFYTRANGSGTDLVELAPNAIAEVNNQQKTFEALGLLWADACGNQDVDYDMAFGIGRRLDKSVCESLLKPEAVARLEDEYSQVSMSELQAVCKAAKGNELKGTR